MVAGLHVLSAPGKLSQRKNVNLVIHHKNFVKASFVNDIALLLLSSPLHFDEYVMPVCSMANETEESNLHFNHCFISGWGSKTYKGLYEADPCYDPVHLSIHLKLSVLIQNLI